MIFYKSDETSVFSKLLSSLTLNNKYELKCDPKEFYRRINIEKISNAKLTHRDSNYSYETKFAITPMRGDRVKIHIRTLESKSILVTTNLSKSFKLSSFICAIGLIFVAANYEGLYQLLIMLFLLTMPFFFQFVILIQQQSLRDRVISKYRMIGLVK